MTGSYKKRKNKKNSANNIRKPYENGTKWFSMEAYEDIDTLRKEYHELANKYHPDNNPDYIEVFMDIQQERLIILEELKNKNS